jgi:YgiT-type zinc finger domain-containing protein
MKKPRSYHMNNNKKSDDYGRCHVCGERMQEQRINQDFWLKGKLVVIESIPAGVCPQCEEKTVKAEVGRQLATLIANLPRAPKRKTITVPVIRYVKAGA